MTYLLDTHALLWWLFDDPALSLNVRAIIAERSNVILVSSASVWEISTKHRLGRLPDVAAFLQDVDGWLVKAGFVELSIGIAHARRAGGWQHPHRDPFDRMLAAQSALENLPLISRDEALRGFGIQLVW